MINQRRIAKDQNERVIVEIEKTRAQKVVITKSATEKMKNLGIVARRIEATVENHAKVDHPSGIAKEILTESLKEAVDQKGLVIEWIKEI